MAVHRLPAMVWRDASGICTAALVEPLTEGETAAVAGTAEEALEQLREAAAHLLAEGLAEDPAVVSDARLLWFKVAVRPETRAAGRVYADDRLLRLRVPAVVGRLESSLLLCAVPTLGLRFFYHDPRSLRDLVTHYALERLKGRDVRALTRYLPAESVELAEIVVRTPRRRERPQSWTPKLAEVSRVAEPLGDRGMRKQLSPAFERDELVARLAEKLGKERANVLLVGESGVGKTTVLAAAARSVERRDPCSSEGEGPRGHRFWLTSAGRLIAGMRYLGQWQERCESVVDELARVDGVLCVASMAELVREGSDGLAAFFAPYLERSELRMVAEATPAELDACRRLAPAFVDLFSVVPVPPLDPSASVRVLDRVAPGLGAHAQRLFARFLPYEAMPGRAIAFLKRRVEEGAVTPPRVVEAFARDTGLPEVFLRDDLLLSDDQVRAWFAERVIGQGEACDEAARLVTTFKAGLSDPARPIAVLLFAGPTGVGKTEMARALARYFFGAGEAHDSGRGVSPERLVRLDMSEYAGPWAASRLVGDGSELLRRVRETPFTVVLLDEIEKADPSVFDILLGVFDEGRLTDSLGRVTTFRSSLIVLTSNLGASSGPSIGFTRREGVTDLGEIARFFRPELFNRIDAVVRFNPLDRSAIESIVVKELESLSKREGFTRRSLTLRWTPAVVAHLAQAGFDPRYGARPLQRALESWLVAPLARWLVEHPSLRKRLLSLDVGEAGTLRIQ